MRTIIVAAVVTLLATGGQAQTRLSNNQFRAALDRIVAASEPNGALDPGLDRKLYAGQPFRVSWAVEDGGASGAGWGKTAGFWTYDPDTRTLRLGVTWNLFLHPPGDQFGSWSGYTFYGRGEAGAPEDRSVHGAKVTVTPARYFEYMLVHAGTSRLYSHPTYEREITIGPDDARALVRNLVLVAEGAVQPYDGVNTMFCATHRSGLTVGSPSDDTVEQCMVAVAIARVAFERKDTGEVIAEWLMRPDEIVAPSVTVTGR